jgi:hypothetical protein
VRTTPTWKKLTMIRENLHAAPGARVAGIGWLSPEMQRVLGAFLATATGTAAGIFVDSGFGVQMSIVNAVYRLLAPLFDVLSAYPNGQLTLAGFIYRIPIVLIIGLLVGLFLRHFRYPRLLLCSILIWPVYFAGRRPASALLLQIGDHGSGATSTFLQIDIVPELVLYSMQYALLIVVIHTTDAVLVRSARGRSASAA